MFRVRRANATVHAFAHGLSSILSFIRHRFSDGPLFKHSDLSQACDFAAIWLHYMEWEEIVGALASLCHRVPLQLFFPPKALTDLSRT